MFAECAARVGDHAGARMLFDRLEPWSAHIANVSLTSWGAVAHYLGLLATCLDEFDVAERYFAQALDIHVEIDAPFFVACTQTELASMLTRRGARTDADRAAGLRVAALETARNRGYAGLEQALLA